MKKLLFIALCSIFTYSLSAQSDFKKKQRISNSILCTVETYDGKKYITSDALFHTNELERVEWIKVEDRYKKMGVKTMLYFKIPADVKIMTWHEFLKYKGIVIHKNDTIFRSKDLPIGTLYQPILSPAYVIGVKRKGHRIYIVYNYNMNRKPSWNTIKTRDSIRAVRSRHPQKGWNGRATKPYLKQENKH